MENVRFDFSDQTVIVTGGSSGIGRAIARQFGDSGATVINADLRPDPRGDAEELPTHEAITEAGGEAEYVKTDVSNPADIESVVEAAREFGGVDVMVNNAGTQVMGSVREVSSDQFDHMSNVNAKGVLFGCQAAANDMIDRGVKGTIINTASIRTDTALDGQILYNATKGAVKMITLSAALELADHDIRVNAIEPGRTVTGLASTTENAEELSDSGDLVKPIPLGSPAQPDDIAPGALFLASDAARYVTGEHLRLDGGWSIY
ncbi:SDR family NAD(P)-dependent oxidoreductase [Halorussus sp. AFM4]|uniref:SDR family NAD(P)-dependent oxidoreductase n=1 Tax=Halorussus sp. AFM4 TaxID=3421651 RepID=UPI003EBCE3C0